MLGSVIVCALTFYEAYALINLVVSNIVHLEFYQPMYGDGDINLFICQIFFEIFVYTSVITFTLAAIFGLLKEVYGKVMFYLLNVCSFIVAISSSLYLQLYYNYPEDLDFAMTHYTKCMHGIFELCSLCLTMNAIAGNIELFNSTGTLKITECNQNYKSFQDESDGNDGIKEIGMNEAVCLGIIKV